MRFMLMTKVTPKNEGLPPDPRLMEAIGNLTAEMAKTGVLVDAGGLMPSALGSRAHVSGGKIVITDGPFTEVKELIGGYAIVDVNSKQEAIEMTRRFLQIHIDILGPDYEGLSEMRQMYVAGCDGPGEPRA